MSLDFASCHWRTHASVLKNGKRHSYVSNSHKNAQRMQSLKSMYSLVTMRLRYTVVCCQMWCAVVLTMVGMCICIPMM